MRKSTALNLLENGAVIRFDSNYGNPYLVDREQRFDVSAFSGWIGRGDLDNMIMAGQVREFERFTRQGRSFVLYELVETDVRQATV